MAKRIADKELTDRNWDQEEEGEEAGTFSVAPEDVLKNRAIKKAKRRNTGVEGEECGTFKGFKGFSLTTSSVGGAFSAFSGFTGLSSLTNGKSPTPTFGGFTPTPGLSFKGPSSLTQTNGSAPGAPLSSAPSAGSDKEYSRQLTALNVSVRNWISKHVDENPLCDLNPIFRDYEHHLTAIEQRYGNGAPAKEGVQVSNSAPAGVTFNFGQKVDSSAMGLSSPALSSSGPALTTAGSAPSFSFSTSSSGSALFGGNTVTKTDDTGKDENKEEELEEPPKPEVNEVKEDDAFYSKKCKLFYKKEAEFKEKGVGTLHLKPMAEGKTQMIIRADTNLGNILLNVLLQASMPCSRVGKNNVMVLCVPNPPVDELKPDSPVPLLVRVKTAEDADELLRTLEEKKS
ncbi:nuclear pore complex protein Nup50 [Gouania willdenowi]|uniref:Nuclear pore complex protein Nup50 n=1 Tax=Gouania willdenowi TaxID=441366 RepID=A0A8C5GD38_GOUWI|nr:nuclear pore complex protein Nup50 [Gouania willdenowi]XP_028305357.1 nuclear pore complex protein Nup50 [Gouania willdenowi]XP_028305358.1 nuclear pore complex protein Nup50 [Gouania willdenowi]XP_028305359.1 nuclear pore complex protein Nup50 [Gouania willdenowi]XP_028305360.1 nuclear pore complex protein Nup50 [Gouania willdenowi]XP_028305361.1 nuclear pore complex protein Nup50 [Gouania willdenowi]